MQTRGHRETLRKQRRNRPSYIDIGKQYRAQLLGIEAASTILVCKTPITLAGYYHAEGLHTLRMIVGYARRCHVYSALISPLRLRSFEEYIMASEPLGRFAESRISDAEAEPSAKLAMRAA